MLSSQATHGYDKDLLYGIWSSLFQYISAELPVDLRTILETWILQTGHPVVTVTRDPDNPAKIQVSQDMFLLDNQRPVKELYTTEYK